MLKREASKEAEPRQVEANQTLLAEVLGILNRGGGLESVVGETLRAIQRATGFDAVGLRLRNGDNYPYFEQNGFTEEFLRQENFLCALDATGAIVRDAVGRALLECTCGLVLSGRTDPNMSCFTTSGSFWTNRSTDLLALPREDDPRTNPRNHCIHVGYQSVGLFPVRSGQEIIGLLQLNDRREGRFTPGMFGFYESLAQNIGLALQRTAAEEALRESERALRDADRRKNEFLAMLAHELRNPLAAVSSALELLKRPELAEQVRERAQDAAARQAAHMASLLDDLLDVARVTTAKVTLNKKDISVLSILENAIEASNPFMNARQHKLYVSHPTEQMRVHGDPVRLTQAIGNLLHNSAKFTPPEGEIYLDVERDGDEAVILVRDNGNGIDTQLLPHIFDLFVQGSRQADRAEGGLGVGLTLVRSVVELHGGRVEARSEGLGKGSEFRIRLPLLPVEERVVEMGIGKAEGTKSRKMLIVDDNMDSAEMISALLEIEGHKVSVAHSGPAAIDLALKEAPEVALVDIGMPGMDGYEVARRLRQLPELSGMILVALTGYGQQEDIQRSREAGFDQHLLKPVDIEALKRVLR